MSGGYWDYIQYRFRDIGDDIEEIIEQNDSNEVDEWGGTVGRHYAPETIAKLRQAAKHVRETAIMLQRVDYLLEGDDGEDSFHQRWDQELEELNEQEQQTEARSQEEERTRSGFEEGFDKPGVTPHR